MAEFIRRPPKTVNRTKDPYDLDKSVQQGAATSLLLAVSPPPVFPRRGRTGSDLTIKVTLLSQKKGDTPGSGEPWGVSKKGDSLDGDHRE